ncbi:glycosyltransferase family 87 protein [Micromonospora sp. NPDC049523]|uniref:glycosyltransferase family 87 protein n=1 Tax=Micromonospora sp. NPDC049523 TaxID=3155921 RepID=UPI003434F38C
MISPDPRGRVHRFWRRLDGAADGLAADLGLYAASAVFAAVTAATSTLLPHRAWGTVATAGYLLAALAVTGQLVARRRGATRLAGTAARAVLTAVTWVTTALLPMVWQCVERAGGRTDRAQEEVVVIEHAGIRLLDHGTPYLGPDAIRALPAGDQLLGYTPYQPGMALFGLPRAIAGNGWWTDARIWFALVTAIALVVAVTTLRRTGNGPTRAATGPERLDGPPARDSALVRAVQLATVLPICALTLATGGDDLPVLALCLLALAFGANHRFGAAGVAIGLAGALKLFAWPVALVLIGYAATRGWRTAARLAAGAIGLPVAALIPVQLVDSSALVENVLRFPLGHGVVSSPAQSPFPGYLIAAALPAGRVIAAALLVGVGLLIAVRLVRRPPRTAGSAALICGYGLLAAIALMPSTRFGYLLYPIAFLAWAPALWLARPGSGPAAADRTPPAAASTR